MTLNRRAMLRRAAAASALLLLAACGKRIPRARPVAAGAAVVALGDSLTAGTGATPEASYPAVLAALTGWRVSNAGVPGDTSAQALERLPALLQDQMPALVLVSIGGNDFLRRQPESQTRANVRRICELVVAAGAQVLLVAVPRPTLAAAFTGSLADHALYAEIADELKLPLQRQGWSAVLGDESLRSDSIHANARGYARFAQAVVATAVATGLLERR